MQKSLVCLHTIQPLLGLFTRLASEILPGIKVIQILDEPLLIKVQQHGRLNQQDINRIQNHRELAFQIGAEAILVTCSSISPYVDELRRLTGIPIFKIDEAMIQEGVERGKRIGVVATAETTLEPTRQLLEMEANKNYKNIQTELVLIPHALDALLNGDSDNHDRLVIRSIMELAERSDVILLAQASMARVLDKIPEKDRRVPILSSPHLALQMIKNRIY